MENCGSKSPVYFGPIKVDEIKTYLSATKSKTNTRHTISDLKPTRIVFENLPEMEANRHFLIDEEDDVEISFTSDYLTAQETISSEKDCEIIDCDTSQSSSCQILSSNTSRNDLNGEKLNDTLEEIEKLLNASVETVSDCTDDSGVNTNPIERINSLRIENDEPISMFNFKSPKAPLSRLPIKRQEQEFKIPLEIPMMSKSPKFKNVVSPVAMYIKNSPKVPLVHHVPMKTITTLPTFKSKHKTDGENREIVLPPVVYRPGKKVVVSKEEDIKLPKSLAKYVPSTPCVIKHEGRVNKRVLPVEELLLQSDLSLRDTTLDSTLEHDISLFTIKNAFK